MSASSERGKTFELEVAKLFRKILGARVERDARSGAGSHQKMDLKNYYRDTRFSVEVKDHQAIKPKEWMRQAEAGSSMGQVPTLVFRMDGKAYAMVPLEDLLHLEAETKDLQAALDDLRRPEPTPRTAAQRRKLQRKIKAQDAAQEAQAIVAPAVQKKRSSGARSCPNGHITDDYGYCQDKHCKYRRGYRPPKGAK